MKDYMKDYMKILFSPIPCNISYMWNFGSLLGVCLMIQLLSGFFLTFFYSADVNLAFFSMNYIMKDINFGWIIRLIHANTANFFFLFIYLHVGRNMFYHSYNLKKVWISGVIILFLLFMTAFIGYVLPWGQMSFWGATVITNLVSSIPYIGKEVTFWIWGGYSINKATLMRFFSVHFLIPLLIFLMMILHLIFLHEKGSSNPLKCDSNLDKVPFYPYFLYKDMITIFIFLMSLLYLSMIFPYMLMDCDNFIVANPMITPPHIQPEWYFLFAYAILRSIPNKLGGVIFLMLSIMILMFLPLNNKIMNNSYSKYIYTFLIMFWYSNMISLSVMGAMPVEDPYIYISCMFSILYFMFYYIYL